MDCYTLVVELLRSAAALVASLLFLTDLAVENLALREGFPCDTGVKYLIFDRDSIFSEEIVRTVRSFGIKPVRTGYRSPWQKGVCERWIASCRRELLDHVVVFNEDHIRRLPADYVSYYHEGRTHLGLEEDAPQMQAVQKKPSSRATVISLPRSAGCTIAMSGRTLHSRVPI